MKYNEDKFNSAVEDYKKTIKEGKGKNFFMVFDMNNKEAFYSMAPLSRAIHELGGDVNCAGLGENNESLEALRDVWKVFGDIHKLKDEKTEALNEFITEVDKKADGKFRELFKEPDFEFKAAESGFEGPVSMPYHTEWFEDYRMDELVKTSEILWRDVYNLQKGERIGIGFPLISVQKLLGHPLEDYLDAYSITWAMTQVAMKHAKPTISSSSARASMLEKSEPISDLRATLLGCELCKEVDEEPFVKFKKVSELLKLDRLKPVDLSFSVHGKGYFGKHLFGDLIGYPSLNKKTRWQTPGQMVYKLDFYPQSKLDDRDPMARVAFTETIPIDIFIETNLVDWSDIRARNKRIIDLMDKCEVVHVEGKLNEKYVTKLEVGLVQKDGTRRWVRPSDTDVRTKINKTYEKMTGIKAGNMANIPGGEAFVTPEYIKGVFVGDVVVHVDQSYPLSEREPIIVQCNGDSYKILEGPKKIVGEINKKKEDAMKQLLEAEKHKSLPQEIIDLKKKNYNRIGEFAINTNPKARLCEYLIVNEKIAKMMHIAMGSGFEADRSTVYHMDIVFNAPRQKLDVFGLDKEGNKHWILKDGEFVAS